MEREHGNQKKEWQRSRSSSSSSLQVANEVPGRAARFLNFIDATHHMQASISLGRWFGVPAVLHCSWFAVPWLITLSLTSVQGALLERHLPLGGYGRRENCGYPMLDLPLEPVGRDSTVSAR
jgi:hypothetical protein